MYYSSSDSSWVSDETALSLFPIHKWHLIPRFSVRRGLFYFGKPHSSQFCIKLANEWKCTIIQIHIILIKGWIVKYQVGSIFSTLALSVERWVHKFMNLEKNETQIWWNHKFLSKVPGCCTSIHGLQVCVNLNITILRIVV